jgi:hypothetical protein
MKFAPDLTLACGIGTRQTGAATYGIRSGFFFTGLHTFHLTCDQQERSLKWEYQGGIF